MVFDSLRGLWVVLTPEEWVRRHVAGWLTAELGVVPQMIVEEYPVELNGQPQRADMVVVFPDGSVRLVVECKAPEVEVDSSVLAQAVRYNSVVRSPLLLLTNGISNRYFLTADFISYREIDNFEFDQLMQI